MTLYNPIIGQANYIQTGLNVDMPAGRHVGSETGGRIDRFECI